MPDGRFDHLAYCGFIGLAQSVELMYIYAYSAESSDEDAVKSGIASITESSMAKTALR